jgi:hypothetical protein
LIKAKLGIPIYCHCLYCTFYKAKDPAVFIQQDLYFDGI